MITLRTLMAISFVFLAGILPAGDGTPEVCTWELVGMEMTKRAGQEYPVHRLILTAEGRYLNSATRGGPIAVNYRVKRADDSPGWFDFLLQVPGEKEFGRGAGLRLDNGKLVMSYRDGRVVTYSRVSEVADEALLMSPEGRNITIQPNKIIAAQDGSRQPASRPVVEPEGRDQPPPEAEERSR